MPSADAAVLAVPAVFDLQATAFLASIQSTQQPAASVITAGLVDATVGYATSTLRDGGGAESLASEAYPGDLIAGGPQLLCANLFPCPVDPPAYPLVADAAWPTTPDATDASGRAQATATATGTLARASAFAPADPTGLGLRWDSGSVLSHAWVDGSGAHVVVTSTLHGVVLGPVRIATLDSSDLVDISAAGAVHDVPAVVAAGVTVAGESASLDQDGLHAAGQHAQSAVQQLAAAGLSLRLLGATRHDGTGSARAAAGGLEITVTHAVAGLPVLPNAPSANRTYVGSVLLGGAGAAALAGDETSLVLGELPPVGPVESRVGPPVSTPAATGGPVLAPGRPPQLPVGGATTYPVVVGRFRLGGLTWDLRPVALALAVVPLALLLLWRGGVGLTLRRRT